MNETTQPEQKSRRPTLATTAILANDSTYGGPALCRHNLTRLSFSPSCPKIFCRTTFVDVKTPCTVLLNVFVVMKSVLMNDARPIYDDQSHKDLF